MQPINPSMYLRMGCRSFRRFCTLLDKLKGVESGAGCFWGVWFRFFADINGHIEKSAVTGCYARYCAFIYIKYLPERQLKAVLNSIYWLLFDFMTNCTR